MKYMTEVHNITRFQLKNKSHMYQGNTTLYQFKGF